MERAAGWVLGASVTIMALGLSIMAPALPLFGRTFGVGAAMVGSLVSAYAVGRLILDLPAGHLVDRVGRRPVLLTSAIVVAVAALLAATAGNFAQLIAWRVLQGAGSGLFTTAAMAAMADLGGTVHRGRALSMFSGAFLIGSSLGPSIGGIVAAHWGVRAPSRCTACWRFSAWSGYISGCPKRLRPGRRSIRRVSRASVPNHSRGWTLC